MAHLFGNSKRPFGRVLGFAEIRDHPHDGWESPPYARLRGLVSFQGANLHLASLPSDSEFSLAVATVGLGSVHVDKKY